MQPVFEQIKAAVPLADALRQYGIQVERGGMAHCPFHGDDKHASMNVKNNFFYCHTCGAHGDVIGLVCRLFGLRPAAAGIRLDNDFRLGLTGKRPSREEVSRIARERAEREEQAQAYASEYRRKTLVRRALWYAYTHHAPRSMDDIPQTYVDACKYLDYYDDWFDHHTVRGEVIN